MIGDVQRGPSSIVAAVGTGVGRPMPSLVGKISVPTRTIILEQRQSGGNLSTQRRYLYHLVDSDDRDAFVAQEAARCLDVTTFAASVWMSARTVPTYPCGPWLPEPFPDAAPRRLL